jgi:hypothetical protein
MINFDQGYAGRVAVAAHNQRARFTADLVQLPRKLQRLGKILARRVKLPRAGILDCRARLTKSQLAAETSRFRHDAL